MNHHKPRPHGALLAALAGLPAKLRRNATPAPRAAASPTPSHAAPAADQEQHAVAQQSPAQAERARCALIVRHGLELSIAARGDLAPLMAATYWAFETDLAADAAAEALDARAAVAGLHRNHHHLAARRG